MQMSNFHSFSIAKFYYPTTHQFWQVFTSIRSEDKESSWVNKICKEFNPIPLITLWTIIKW